MPTSSVTLTSYLGMKHLVKSQELMEQIPGSIDAFCGAVGGAGMYS